MALNTKFNAKNGISVGVPSVSIIDNVGNAIFPTVSAGQYLGLQPSLSGLTALVGGNSLGSALTIGTNDNYDLNLETGGSSRVTVTSAGDVGIGSTTPATKLTVVGGVSATGGFFGPGITVSSFPTAGLLLTYGGSSAGASYVDFFTSGSHSGQAAARLRSSNFSGGAGFLLGRSGFFGWNEQTYAGQEDTGTGIVRDSFGVIAQRNSTSPQELRIYKSYTDASNYERFIINTNAGATGATQIGLSAAGTGQNRNLEIVTGGSTRMTILSGGNVGIGTAAPTERLNIVGNVKTEGNLSVYNLNTAITLDRLTVDGSQGRLFTVTDALTGSLLSVNDISGLPILEVFDDDRVIMGEYASNALAVVGKNVGVGKAVPTAKLDILDTVLAGSGALSGSALSIAQTWNTTGNPTAFKLNATNTSSGASSNLLDLQVDGSSKFKINKSGAITVTNNIAATGDLTISTPSNLYITAPSGNSFIQQGGVTLITMSGSSAALDRVTSIGFALPNNASNIFLTSVEAYGVLSQRNGANPQAFRLYNTYTDPISAFERLNIKWAANVAKIGTEKGSVGGLARDLALETNGTTRMTITSGGNVGIGTVVPDNLLHIDCTLNKGILLTNTTQAPGRANFYINAGTGGAYNAFNISESYDSVLYSILQTYQRSIYLGGFANAITTASITVLNDQYKLDLLHLRQGPLGSSTVFKVASSGETTVSGNISSTRVIYASGGNSDLWNSAYTAVTAISANTANYILDGGNTKGANLLVGTNDNFNLNLETAGTTKMTITSAGFVGVGIAAPTANLDIPGSGDTSLGHIMLGKINHGGIIKFRRGSDGAQAAYIGYGATDGGPGFTLNSGGGAGAITLLAAGGPVNVYSANTNPYIFAANGSFGVGTITPVAKLDILDTTLAGSGALSGSALNISQTWNTTGNPTAFTLNVTNSASGTTSNLLDLQVGGSSKFKVDKNGATTMSSALLVEGGQSALTSSYLQLANSAGRINFNSNIIHMQSATGLGWFDLPLWRDAANTLAQRNGVNPQAFRLYSTYTDASNYERFFINTNVGATSATQIGLSAAGTGQSRNLEFANGGSTRMTITSAGDVGVATTTPLYRFSVKPNPGAAGQIGVGSYPSGSAPALYLQNANAEAPYHIGVDNSGTLNLGNATYNILQSAGYFTTIKGNGTSIQAGNGSITLGVSDTSSIVMTPHYSTNAIQFIMNGGTERMRISGAGLVGIGTATPNERLTVVGVISSTNVIYASGGNSDLWNSAYSSVTAISSNSTNYILDGGNTKGANLLVGTNDGYALNLETAGTTKMSITSAGLVGIGIATPSSILDINDSTGSQKNVTLSLRNGSFGWWTMTSSNSNTAGFLRFASNNSGQTPLTLDGTTGNVGIANNNPTAKLDILDNTLASSGGLQGSALSVTQTWATSGSPTLIYGRVTNTSSGAASNLIDLGTVANGTLFKVTKAGNISFGQSVNFTQGFEPSSNTSFNIRCYGTTIGGFAATDQPQGLHLNNSSSVVWTNAAGGIGSFASVDLYLNRRGPANLRLGAVDAAAPVAQTLSVQSVVSGTTNTGGANLTITGSQGTGTGPGGSIIFQTAPAGSSGTVQNGLSAALTIDSSLNTYSASNFIVPNVSGKGFWVTGSPTHGGMVNAGGLGGVDFKANAETVLSLVNNSSQRRTQLHVSGELGFSSDLTLIRDAANTLAMRNGINPQTFRLYNTYSNSTTFERADVKWDSTALKIGTDKGTSGGAATPIHFYTDSISRMIISSTGLVTVRDEAGTQQQVINNYSYINNSFTDGGPPAAPWLLDASTNDILHNYATRLNVTNTGTVAASGVFTRLIEWPASELTDANGMTYTDGYVIVRCYSGGNAQSVRVRVWNNLSGVWSSYFTAIDVSKNASWGLWRANVGGNYMTKLEVETTSPPGNSTSIQSIEYYPVRLNYGIRYPHRFAAQGADKLLFGGGKSTHAAIVGSGNTLKIRNGNDSADGSITAAAATFSTTLSVAGISTFSTIRTSIVDLIRSDANLMPGALAVDSTGGQFVSLGNCGNSNGTNIYGNSTQGVGIYVGSTVDLLKPTALGRLNGTTSNTDLSIYNSANSQTKVGIRLGNSSTAASSNIAINFVDYTNADYGQIRGVYNGAVQTGQLAFLTANGGALAETLRITNTGSVGIGTTTPNEKLTVVGAISSSNVVYASGGNSNLWNSAYTSATANNATIASTYTTVNTNSANWSGVFTTTNTNSANWSGVYTTTNANSANWNSVYSSYNTASATIHNGTVTSTSQGNVTIPKLGGVNESITLTNLGTTGSPTFANLTVSGSLSVVGDFTYLDTAVSVTSALSVVNTGTGPALLVRQSGATPIAHFIDADGTGDIIFANNGFVGLGVASPTQRLTVVGNISSTSVVYASGGVFSTTTITTPDTNTQAITVLGQSGGQAAKLQSWGWASSPNETYIDGSGNLFARSVSTNSSISVGSFTFGSLTAESGGGTGLYGDNTSQEIRLKTGTAVKWKITNTGHLLANTDNTYDIGANGATRPRNVYIAGSVEIDGSVRGGTVYAGPTGNATSLTTPTNGILRITNNSATDFNRLQFGGGTSSFPSIKRNGATLQIRLADDSANAALETANLTTIGTISSTSVVYASGGNSNLWNSAYTSVTAISANSANYILDGGNTKGANLLIGTNDNFNLNLETAGTTKMTVTSAGDVGIGITSPAYKLAVNGGIYISAGNSLSLDTSASGIKTISSLGNDVTVGGAHFISTFGCWARGTRSTGFDATAAGGDLQLTTAGVEKVRVTTAGNVGIGTTGPNAKLEVVESTSNVASVFLRATTAASPRAEFIDGAGTPNRWSVGAGAGTTTDGKFFIYDARQNINRFIIDASGNVGIGTITPNEKLTVVGAISSSNVVYASGGNSNLWNSAYTSATANNATVASTYTTVNSNSANWSSVYTTTNANSANWNSVYTTTNSNSANWNSVYTTTNTNSANYILDGGNTKGANLLVGTNDNFNLNLETAGTTKMTVTSSGNVGIGTTSIQTKLDVNGDTRAGGFLYVDRTSGNLTSYFQLKARGAAEVSNYGNPVGNGAAEFGAVGMSGLIVGTQNATPLVLGTSNAERVRITATGDVGIGTVSPNNKLDVIGNAFIGDSTTAGTALAVSTGPGSVNKNGVSIYSSPAVSYTALSVQTQWTDGNGGDIVKVFNATGTKFLINNNGNVGIGTATPNEKLTVTGNISASNIVYATGGNSSLWNSAYTTANAISANSVSTYTTVNANSANWNSVYTTTNANSANWTSAYTSVNTNSPNWNSVYTTTNANSANWSSTYTSVTAISAISTSVYTTTNANSANWSSVYSTVNANSANYILDGGNTKGANLLVGTNDGFALNFETNGTTKMSVTSAGNVGIGTTTPTSKLEIVDTTSAISLSGAALNIAHTWNAPGIDVTAIKLNVSSSASGANSKLIDLQIGGTSYFNVDKTGATTMASAVFVNGGNSNQWNSNYTTTNTNSAKWNSDYTTVNTSSASWSSVYTTVNAASANYIVNGGNTTGGTITIGTNDANNFNLESNGTARISMSATGQVGVGTLTPDVDFVVYKNVIGSPTTFKIRTATGTGSRQDFYRTDGYVATRFDVLSTNEFQFYNNNDVATPKYIINGTNGNFGIGTTSTVHKVTVGGSLSASGTLYGDCAVLGDATASVSLERDAANTLGIRTTTAAQTLNVYGTYTSGTNFERLTLAASALGGVIGHYAGGGGGVARDLIFQTSNATRMTIAAAGSVNVAGHFSAATKSFLIDHPTQEGKKLQYGVVESNQHSVLVRGRTSDSIIELPEEWSGLVHEDSVTVQLTPIGSYQQLYVVSQDNQKVVVGGSTGKYNYTIYGERKDVDKLQTVV